MKNTRTKMINECRKFLNKYPIESMDKSLRRVYGENISREEKIKIVTSYGEYIKNEINKTK